MAQSLQGLVMQFKLVDDEKAWKMNLRSKRPAVFCTEPGSVYIGPERRRGLVDQVWESSTGNNASGINN
jgi:hypothetical protein